MMPGHRFSGCGGASHWLCGLRCASWRYVGHPIAPGSENPLEKHGKIMGKTEEIWCDSHDLGMEDFNALVSTLMK